MTTLSEAGLVGMVLFLVFSAACYYLYMRTTQIERKVSLLENILFDLKTATEHTLLSNEISHAPLPAFDPMEDMMSPYSNDEFPVQSSSNSTSLSSSAQVKTIEIKEIQPYVEHEESNEMKHETPSTPIARSSSVTKNYESMNYIELKEIARSIKIKGFTHMTKRDLAEALRRYDAGEPQSKFNYGRGSDSETVSLQNYKDLDQQIEGDADVIENNSAFL